MEQHLKDSALKYVDNQMSPNEKILFENQLTTNASLRRYTEALQFADKQLRSPLVEPSKNFTASVMLKLNESPSPSRAMSIGKSLLLLGGILTVLTIGVILLTTGVFDQTTTLDPNNLGITQQYLKRNLPVVSIDGKLIVNVILLLNLVLIFIVLDRAVLRPLFQRRMETGHL